MEFAVQEFRQQQRTVRESKCAYSMLFNSLEMTFRGHPVDGRRTHKMAGLIVPSIREQTLPPCRKKIEKHLYPLQLRESQGCES
jgi:hypothetical protein